MARFSQPLAFLLITGLSACIGLTSLAGQKQEPQKGRELIASLSAPVLGIEDNLGFFKTASDAPKVLPQGARVWNLPSDKTFAVLWFPKNYKNQPVRRALFVLHGSRGNAYMGVQHQLEMAKKYGFGLISLQYWLGGEQYLQPKQIVTIFSGLMPYLSREYGLKPEFTALETFSRSASISYELAYWDKAANANLFRLIISQSGGISADKPRPLIRQMMDGKLGESPLKGTRFFLYCGEKDQQGGVAMCESVRNAKKLIETEGGTVVRFVSDPVGGHGGLHNAPRHFQSAMDAFLASTPGVQ